MTDPIKTWLKPLDEGEPSVDLFERARRGPSGSLGDIDAPATSRTRIGAALVATVVFIAAVVFAWRAFTPAPRIAVQSVAAPAGSTDVTIHSGDAAPSIQVEVPPGWSVAQKNLTPWLSQPSEVLSVGTFDMPVSHDPGDEPRVFDAPVAPAALAAMTATDAFVSLQASGPTDAPDDRPPSFRTAKDRACCSAQTGAYPFTWWWTPFVDQGRAFYLFVAVGNQADSTTSDQAWAIADSLMVADAETPTASATP